MGVGGAWLTGRGSDVGGSAVREKRSVERAT